MKKKLLIFLSIFVLMFGGITLASCSTKKDNSDDADSSVYKVNYVVDDEIIHTDEVKGGIIKKFYKPTKEGYEIEGYYTDDDFATEVELGEKITDDINVYIKWQKVYKETTLNKRITVYNALTLDDTYFVDLVAKDYNISSDDVDVLTTDWMTNVTADTKEFKISLLATTDSKKITINYIVTVDANVKMTISGEDEIIFGTLSKATSDDILEKYDVNVVDSLGNPVAVKTECKIEGTYDLSVAGVYNVVLNVSIPDSDVKASKNITIKVLEEYTVNFYETDGKTLIKSENVLKDDILSTATTASLDSDALFDYEFSHWVDKTTMATELFKASEKLTMYELNNANYYYDTISDLFYSSLQSYVYNNANLNNKEITVTSNLDLIPIFTTKHSAYQIKLITNGGVLDNTKFIKVDDNYYTFTQKDGTIVLESPSKDNCHFVDWFKNDALTEAYPNTTTENMTLYAKYQNYTISFISEYGNAPSSIKGVIRIPDTLPTIDNRELETFNGWYKDDAYTNAVVCGEEIFEDVTLYAKWTEKPFNVNLVDDDGKTVQTISMVHFDSKSLPALDDKELYLFTGWTNGPEEGTRLTNDVTLKPKWEHKKFTINYSIKSKIAEDVVSVEKDYVDENTLKAPEMSNLHYQFVNWTYDEEGKSVASVKDEITKETTLYAQFKRIGYYYTGTITATLHSETETTDTKNSSVSLNLNNTLNNYYVIYVALEEKVLEESKLIGWETVDESYYDYGDGDTGYTYTYAPAYIIPVKNNSNGSTFCARVIDMTQAIDSEDSYYPTATPLSFTEAYNRTNTTNFWYDIEYENSIFAKKTSYLYSNYKENALTFALWIDKMLDLHETTDAIYSYESNISAKYYIQRKFNLYITTNETKYETVPNDYNKEFYSCFDTKTATDFTAKFYWYSQKENGDAKVTLLLSDATGLFDSLTTDIYGQDGTNPIHGESWSESHPSNGDNQSDETHGTNDSYGTSDTTSTGTNHSDGNSTGTSTGSFGGFHNGDTSSDETYGHGVTTSSSNSASSSENFGTSTNTGLNGIDTGDNLNTGYGESHTESQSTSTGTGTNHSDDNSSGTSENIDETVSEEPAN